MITTFEKNTTINNVTDFLVQEVKKGYFRGVFTTKEGIQGFAKLQYNIQDVETKINLDEVTNGSVLKITADFTNFSSDPRLINITVFSEILPNPEKEKVITDLANSKLGMLIDGVPVKSFGKAFIKDGKKVNYAYFK